MKKFTIALFICVFMFSTPVFAHTGVQSSTPSEGEVVKDDLSEIMIEFNTDIEKTSSFKLVNQNGEEISIDNIQIDNSVMTGDVLSPLPNGTYNVNWKIVGADGHPIEGTYSFIVENASEVVPQEDFGQIEEESSDDESHPANHTSKIDNVTPVESNESYSSSNGFMVILLVILAFIAGATANMLIRRGKN